MKRILVPAVAVVTFCYANANANANANADVDDPVPAPRTHIDTTVVGDARPDDASAPSPTSGLDNDHQFVSGAPDIVNVTKRLHLSPRQEAQIKDTIQKADAGAAVLIKREHDVKDMVAATTPQDPLYPKLILEQADGPTRWSENRENLRRDVLNLLTPAQQARFEELEPKSKSEP